MKVPEIAGGPPVRDPHVRRPVQPASVEGISFAGVHPLRLAEIRRRVGIVKSFLSIERPEEEDRIDHANALGLSVSQFLGLARAWRAFKTPAALDGAGTKRGTPRSTGPRNLPTESKEVAAEVINSVGPDVSHAEAVRLIETRCNMLDVKPPSKSTIWNMIMEARRDDVLQTGGNEIVIGRCHIRLPTMIDGEVMFPWIALAVDTKDGAIRAAAMHDELRFPETFGSALVRHLQDRELVVDTELVQAIYGQDAPKHEAVKSSAARTAIAKVLGRGIGSLVLLYQVSRVINPERALITRKDQPLKMGDVEELVLKELIAHNKMRHQPPPKVSWVP